MISGYAATRGRGTTVREITGGEKDVGSSWLGNLPAMVEAKEVWAGGERGRDAASRAALPPSAPRPQQPPPKGGRGAREARRAMGRRAGCWETPTASREKPPQGYPLRLHPLPRSPGLSVLQGPVTLQPGAALSLQLASSSAAGGRRTGRALCGKDIFLQHAGSQFPSCLCKGLAAALVSSAAGGLGTAGTGLLLATSPWPAPPGAEGTEAPGAGLSASHVGSAGGWRGAMAGEGFPPQLPAPSRAVETSGGQGQGLLLQFQSLSLFLGSPAATASKPGEPWSAAASHPHVRRGACLPPWPTAHDLGLHRPSAGLLSSAHALQGSNAPGRPI